MNQIEKLLAELCPEGVEFRELGKVLKSCENIKWVEQGDKEFKYIDLGSVDRSQHKIVEWTTINKDNAPSRAQQILKLGDVIFGTTRPMLKRYCLVSELFDGQIASTGYCVLRANAELILPNYIFHSIGTEKFYDFVLANERGASYPAIPDNVIKRYKIALPSLAIQNKIVTILDKFVELQAELQAELQKRKLQYEYYRNNLLSFKEKSLSHSN